MNKPNWDLIIRIENMTDEEARDAIMGGIINRKLTLVLFPEGQQERAKAICTDAQETVFTEYPDIQLRGIGIFQEGNEDAI
jgi:hypothetical protein